MIIGLDVGGTHTDAILLDAKGLVRKAKVHTDPQNLFETILQALEETIADTAPESIHRVVLSTTLATNLVVQQQLPAVGMVVAAGPGIDPAHFRTNVDYHVVKGGLDHRGREIDPLDQDRIVALGQEFQRQGIRYAGVVSKFSVRNPQHENAMADLLAPYVEQVFKGNTFSGGLNFPRRIATTYLNTAVYPVYKKFFEAVQQSLAQKGFSMPMRILKPDGGNMSFESSLDHPAQTILSGPSASVMGTLSHAPRKGASLVLDIGGTTTDMAVLIDGVPLLAPQGIEILPYKTLIRALKTQSIGIGGDSVVRLKNGQITIGPDRLGKAMAYGGPAPTPTDAIYVLGLGQTGDREKAHQGLAPIAGELGLSVEQTAGKIFASACRRILDAAQSMVDAINDKPVYTVHELYEGSKIEPAHLLVMGGPAPQFGEKLATMFHGEVTVVPHWDVANAIGCALARTTSELTLFADTARQVISVPGEQYSCSISSHFELEDARQIAHELLRERAIRQGARNNRIQTEIIEESEFNMIRGFHTVGKNIRIKAQIKPGLIEFD
ncbi:MAG: hydantoinase/oxoprolinase family protein [Desulfobacteraceae bacterium]